MAPCDWDRLLRVAFVTGAKTGLMTSMLLLVTGVSELQSVIIGSCAGVVGGVIGAVLHGVEDIDGPSSTF